MKLLNLLIISFLLIKGPGHSTFIASPCREIKATAEVKNSSGQRDGTITVTIDGNSANFRVSLVAPKKEDNRLNLPVEEIKNLPAGNYELVITEAREGEFCPKHIKVAIK